MGRSRRKKKKGKKPEEPKMGCTIMGAVCLLLATLAYLFVIEHFRKDEVEEDRNPADDCWGTQLYCGFVALVGLLAIPRHCETQPNPIFYFSPLIPYSSIRGHWTVPKS